MLALLTLAVANWALIWPLYVRVRRLERLIRLEIAQRRFTETPP